MAVIRFDEFEEDFENEEREIYALIKEEPSGGLIYKVNYIRPLVHTYAVMGL